MQKRFVTIWFRFLKTDWLIRRKPALAHIPFVFQSPERGRMMIRATNRAGEKLGIQPGMVVADARAIYPGLQVFQDDPALSVKLLKAFADYCIRFTPAVAIDNEDGLILDASGCSHLWGSERDYVTSIINRFQSFGYQIKATMADTIGAAWAVTHYGEGDLVIEKKEQKKALRFLSAASLRLDKASLELLYKLGFKQISSFIDFPRSALRRRFGELFVLRLEQALGILEENMVPVHEPQLYHARLPCPELILTPKGIEIALERLLEMICLRLRHEQKGLRAATFKCFRVDARVEEISIGTNRASNNKKHLNRLFELKLEKIEPAHGIELFTLDATFVDELLPAQEKIWIDEAGFTGASITEFIDRVSNRPGTSQVNRYLPDEHYWPERSFREATSFTEQSAVWNNNKPRPLHMLSRPEQIEVTAPIPDYPPMLFRYEGRLHTVKKADGPERIEREWWIDDGPQRDYYSVEDENGNRYWLYRLGHYSTDKKPTWFLHGFFA